MTRIGRPIYAEALTSLHCFARKREGRADAEVDISVLYQGTPEFVLALLSPAELDFFVRSLRRCGREAWGRPG